LFGLYEQQRRPEEHEGGQSRRPKEFAEDWYLELRGKQRAGELISERVFALAVDAFQKEYEVITEGQRGAKWVNGHKARIRLP